jgi:hypothetical protein
MTLNNKSKTLPRKQIPTMLTNVTDNLNQIGLNIGCNRLSAAFLPSKTHALEAAPSKAEALEKAWAKE